jgi:sec-independent protein translocase protein TatA
MEGLLQPTHLILILVIALLVFGPRKLPELGQGLGSGIRGFRDALRGASGDSSSPEAQAHPVPSHAISASPSTHGKKAAEPPLHRA